jgi:predicted transcriptional regulator
MKNERRTPYEIYWEILVFCKVPRSFTAIIHRCDLNSKTGQDYIGFLVSKGYLSRTTDEGKSSYIATGRAGDYIALFSDLYQKLFDTIPGFKL